MRDVSEDSSSDKNRLYESQDPWPPPHQTLWPLQREVPEHPSYIISSNLRCYSYQLNQDSGFARDLSDISG